MKYKIGDKVKIKTWEKMEKEFDLRADGDINSPVSMTKSMEKYVNLHVPGRIAIIKTATNTQGIECYEFENSLYAWTNDMIECLVEDYKKEIFKPVKSRFDILDIRNEV